VWAYDAAFASRNPRAPAFPPALRAALERGNGRASQWWESGGREGREVALATSWPDGPCAFLLARRAHPDRVSAGETWIGAAALGGGVLLAVLLAAGPVVRRLRRLERDVERVRTSGWKDSVAMAGDDEVASLARAFDGAGEAVRAHVAELESRERTLREFVADTTHDLAIPLTVLQGHLVALRDAIAAGAAGDDARVRRCLEETHYVGMLVQNLATRAHLESGRLEPRRDPVDLAEVVRRAVARHAPIARGRGVSLDQATPEGAVVVTGDATLLEQAVSNLVHNAVAYGDAGGHVAVVLQVPRSNGRFFLRVLDDGPGLPPEDLARATERSFRGREARTRRPGGEGLGLAIVREVVERHGFELTLGAMEPHGLRVEIQGPRAATPEGGGAPASPRATPDPPAG
jgi:signal transduction histidine kinase